LEFVRAATSLGGFGRFLGLAFIFSARSLTHASLLWRAHHMPPESPISLLADLARQLRLCIFATIDQRIASWD
jgi:hypothetical protein